ncbi:unnamed protein product [Jaminaea pallidilutea]
MEPRQRDQKHRGRVVTSSQSKQGKQPRQVRHHRIPLADSFLLPIHRNLHTILDSSIMASQDLAATYAALILADEQQEITADKIVSLTQAANCPVEPIWATLLAKALEGKDVKELLSNVGSGAGGAAAAAPAAAAGGAAPAAEEKKEEKKEEAKEESDDDMGFGLFD